MEITYEYVRGEGWIPERITPITWADFMSYQFDHYICILCGYDAIAHTYNGVAYCRKSSPTVGKFKKP